MKDPIFIVGMARTGTTLMARILNQSKEIYILNETHCMRECEKLIDKHYHFVNENYEKLYRLINLFLTIQHHAIYGKNNMKEYPKEAKAILKEYFSNDKNRDLSWLLKCFFNYECQVHYCSWPGDQTPNHVFYIKQLAKLFPQAKFINMIRDPRAVILSQKNKWMAGKRKGQPLFEIIRTRLNYHPIIQSIYWNKSVDAALIASNELNKDQIIHVCFEKLIYHPIKTIKKVCSFLGIGFSSRMLNVSVSMSSNIQFSNSGLNIQVIDQWKKLLPKTQIYLVDKLTVKQRRRFGYLCENVSPNMTSVVYFFSLIPFQILLIVLLNLGRIKNPISYIHKIFDLSN